MLSATIGIPHINDLVHYLGVPISYDIATKSTYQALVDRVISRLCSWQANSLSFTGCLTLLQSVLAVIPQYTMQSSEIPKATLESMEKLCRNVL